MLGSDCLAVFVGLYLQHEACSGAPSPLRLLFTYSTAWETRRGGRTVWTSSNLGCTIPSCQSLPLLLVTSVLCILTLLHLPPDSLPYTCCSCCCPILHQMRLTLGWLPFHWLAGWRHNRASFLRLALKLHPSIGCHPLFRNYFRFSGTCGTTAMASSTIEARIFTTLPSAPLSSA